MLHGVTRGKLDSLFPTCTNRYHVQRRVDLVLQCRHRDMKLCVVLLLSVASFNLCVPAATCLIFDNILLGTGKVVAALGLPFLALATSLWARASNRLDRVRIRQLSIKETPLHQETRAKQRYETQSDEVIIKKILKKMRIHEYRKLLSEDSYLNRIFY